MQLRQYVVEVLCKEGVLPTSLDHMQQATAWVAIYQKAAMHERDALLTLMGLRAKLQVSGFQLAPPTRVVGLVMVCFRITGLIMTVLAHCRAACEALCGRLGATSYRCQG